MAQRRSLLQTQVAIKVVVDIVLFDDGSSIGPDKTQGAEGTGRGLVPN